MKKVVKPPKSVAWGYLLPVSNNGNINCSILDNWKLDSDKSKVRSNKEVNLAASTLDNHDGERADPTVEVSKDIHLKMNWLRVQLYEYKDSDGIIGFFQRKIMGWPQLHPHYKILNNETLHDLSAIVDKIYDDNSTIPNVYLQFRLQRHKKIADGLLTVALSPKMLQKQSHLITLDKPLEKLYSEMNLTSMK